MKLRSLGSSVSLGSTLVLLCTLNITALAQNQPRTSAPAPKFQLEPCSAPGQKADQKGEARCGKYEVFENRATKAGRKLALNVMVLPSLNAKPAPDPVFFIAGGPGQGIVGVIQAGVWKDLIAKIRRERDVVLVDQRGTGESNRLQCAPENKDDMEAYFKEKASDEMLRKCRAELEKIADLTLYSTPIAMDDLDEVRAALGYEQINLLGGSYGTTASLAYLRQYPQRVRSVTLTGVAPPDYRIPLPFAKSLQHSIDRTLEDCAADTACHKDFPNLREEFNSVLAKLDKGPVKFETVNPITNKPQSLTMSREMFINALRLLLYSTDTARYVPLLIHASAEEEFTPLASTAFAIGRALGDQIALGMHFSVTCAEDVPFIPADELARETAGTYLGDFSVKAYQKVCALWPQGKVPASFATPVKSDVPVLLFSGDLDPVSPAWVAEAAARHLPNSRHVVVREAGHTATNECIDGLMAEFISKGSARGLDTSCVNQIHRTPFVTLEMVRTAAAAQQRGSVQGPHDVWEGTLEAGGAKLRLVLKLAKAADGTFTGTLDSPDQSGAVNLPIDTITSQGTSFRFEMKLIAAIFEGTMSQDGTSISGEWKQGGQSLPITFKRTGSSSPPRDK